MAPRRRDFAAEARARYGRLRAQGFNQTEARGHAEESRTAVKVSDWRRVFKLSCEGIPTSLVQAPTGRGSKKGKHSRTVRSRWSWTYVAVRDSGEVVQISFKQVPPKRVCDMIKRHGCVCPSIVGS